MSRTIKSVLFGLLLCAGFISCEKEYSIENGNGTGPVGSGSAVFTFVGAPNTCSSPVINGTYKAGTAMGAGNTVILNVNVTVAGTYTISTGSVNGVTFSATSSFSATGLQIVQLVGSGTPVSAGPFNYTPGTSGCAFSITFVSNGGISTGTANYTCTSLVATGTYTQNSTLGTSNTLVLQVNVTTAGSYSITNGPNDGFTFSGSGNLALGAQTITLAGSGIPAQPGIATFSFGSGTNVCSVDITVASATGGGADYLKATIGGTAMTFNTSLSGQIDNTSVPSSLDIDGSLNSTATDDLSISFNNTSGMITTGTYKNFSPSNLARFGVIYYTDNAGNTYTSNPIDANAATFNLTTLTATNATGTFSGTVTIITTTGNGFGTATKTFTNGSFSVTF